MKTHRFLTWSIVISLLLPVLPVQAQHKHTSTVQASRTQEDSLGWQPAAADDTPEADWAVTGDQAEARIGDAVATAGDVNGDGYADVIVGASEYWGDQAEEGKVFVYYGSASGPSATFDWSAEGNQNYAEFGYEVATAGDVNGDGYDDVLVGAPALGRAYLYLGSAAGLAATPAWTATGNQAGARFGSDLGTAGDVNGDGFADVIVGAYAYNNGSPYQGRAYVFLGSAAGLSADPDWLVIGNQENAWYGWSVGTAGDVNKDGYDDVLVGAEFHEVNQKRTGAVFVYHGSAAGLSATPDWQMFGSQAWEHLGFSAGTAGDVNGDGYSDVIIGGDGYSNGQTEEGHALVFHGSAAGLAATPAWSFESNQTFAYFGWSVAAAGDVNNDGFDDAVVGTPYYDNPLQNEGQIWVFYGSAGGLSATPAWTAKGNQANADLSYSVETAGDVNGDGFSDVIAGAPFLDTSFTNAGAAYVFLGKAGDTQRSLYLPVVIGPQ